MGSCCWQPYYTAHFTGYPGKSCPSHIDGAYLVGVSFKAATDALEPRLTDSVAGGDVSAARAGTAGVGWRHSDEGAAVPLRLVCQLSAELAPSLVEDGVVEL